ncbi:enoyl-CoA hydratase domain-containing protein 2, mitochondrial isoform X5 [Pongo pygmaeus]|nr:enoyl-CoA hydratase domain-containing protein 2, mitochondrial isoform X5 [Pongo pygmaeus]XP_054343441.1 enoyl-CoA hydratase domain-containing protein 2, mitochondrial isoform X5 [Pongo pygmaeus]XP_054343449.1 enoyl-CoA hydratase domain-containing protein 2, mitochondrial isoform X5 [Pongo pygmaeus]XP_054343457.1 enoyl-CoA hydratase domain-containing protein 2, mitochondrial isoform X5 [Pongo pygmaeus]XP_054343467.1 enoyl-CoA hydratase domain-containing protein 2, mitochondrial isoform X5 [P
MNRPSARNALGNVFVSELLETLAQLREDQQVRVLLFRSGVKGVFCAGADLKEREQMSEAEVGVFVQRLRGLMNDIAAFPAPTIAAMDGFALGGGLELALACDLRVAGTGPGLGAGRGARESGVSETVSLGILQSATVLGFQSKAKLRQDRAERVLRQKLLPLLGQPLAAVVSVTCQNLLPSFWEYLTHLRAIAVTSQGGQRAMSSLPILSKSDLSTMFRKKVSPRDSLSMAELITKVPGQEYWHQPNLHYLF